MRIGVMFRSADETGGIGVYARSIINELLSIDEINEYILFYRTKTNIGRYSKYSNCIETHVKASNKVIWDQIAVPLFAKRENIDLIFHPKFTVPFLTKCKTIMVVHGADQLIPPYDKVYNKIDVRYIKTVMPLYFKKADAVLSVSNFCTQGFINVLPQFADKIKTIYFAPNRVFKKINDVSYLQKIKEKFKLPDKFIFTVIRYDNPIKNKRKNLTKMIEAFSICKTKYNISHKFFVIGKNCDKYKKDLNIGWNKNKEDIIFTGLVEQTDLPAFYNLADLYLYPTIIEAFPIPITEAMACGCPIVTSNGTGLKELAGDAAMLVDPNNAKEIANAIHSLLNNVELRKTLITRGLKRSKIFDWGKCAKETLSIIESVAS